MGLSDVLISLLRLPFVFSLEVTLLPAGGLQKTFLPFAKTSLFVVAEHGLAWGGWSHRHGLRGAAPNWFGGGPKTKGQPSIMASCY